MNSRTLPVIAIDGPSGVGKSTLASRLAETFGFTKLDTGAMYRAFALKAIESDADLDSSAELQPLLFNTRITLEKGRVILDTVDVTDRVRESDVTQAASRISVHPRVREWMVAQQQQLGCDGGVVMEGRDVGTAIFPDAEIKIFLDADERVRSARRYLQQQASAPAGDGLRDASEENEVRQQIRERDERDRSRSASPLVPAADATAIDTTTLSLEEVLERCTALVRERFPHLPVTDLSSRR